LSGRLLKYINQHRDRVERLKQQYGSSILLMDSLFESGNLLQAEKSAIGTDVYNLFMQVDTNTRGHQQWFYFRTRGGHKGKTYTFNIMNFTKPGVTGGKGYKG
jgi:cytosolic carboxypeptidase protein 2/3